MVDSRVEWRRGEETVVKEGTFEDSMDEEIEGVPDEENAQTAWGGLGQDFAREPVGSIEDHKNGE